MNITLHSALRVAFLTSGLLAAPAFAGQLSASITTPRNAYSYNDLFAATINNAVTASAPTLNARITGTVPAGAVLLGAASPAPSPWSCSATGQTFDCNAAALPATGVQAPITLSLKAGTSPASFQLSATASADLSPAQTAVGEFIAIYDTIQGTCRSMHGANALVYQVAFTDATGGNHENRPGTEGTYAFRLCNTTATPHNNVIHTVDLPAEVSPDLASPETNAGWSCAAGPSGSTRCTNVTGETSLSNGWQLGNTARRELHYRIAAQYPPTLFSQGGPGCGSSWCPPTFDPHGLGYLAFATYDDGVLPNTTWSIIPAGTTRSEITFGSPSYFDRSGAASSTWQPEGLALIPVITTGTGELTRSWITHLVQSASSSWMSQDPSSSWDCSLAGRNNFPNAPTVFSTCRTSFTQDETPRGTPVTRQLALRASASAPAGGTVRLDFCTGNRSAPFDYGFGPTYNFGPNTSSTDIIAECQPITLPLGVTTPVSLQSFTIE